MKRKIDWILVLGLIMASLAVGGIAVNYSYPPSNQSALEVKPTPTPTPSPSAAVVTTVLTINSSSIWSGESVVLTATLDQPLNGIIVNFMEGPTVVGTNSTINGVATVTIIPPVASWPTPQNHYYVAQPEQ